MRSPSFQSKPELLLLTLLFLLVAIASSNPGVASIQANSGELSSSESAAVETSKADAIVEASLAAATDTLVQVQPGASATFRLVRYVTLRDIRPIKGTNLEPVIRAYIHESNPLFAILAARATNSSSIRGIYFLSRGTIEATPESGGSPVQGWALSSWPGSFQFGGLRANDPGYAAQRRQIERIVASQVSDSLAQHADLIVVGNVGPSGIECPPLEKPRICASIAVDSVIAGRAASQTVYVRPRVRGLIMAGPGLFFLRDMSDGTFDLVGYKAGALRIQEGRIGWPGEAVSAFSARLRQSARKSPK